LKKSIINLSLANLRKKQINKQVGGNFASLLSKTEYHETMKHIVTNDPATIPFPTFHFGGSR
jgi:hypothetical protein